jgi:hypothetical protein
MEADRSNEPLRRFGQRRHEFFYVRLVCSRNAIRLVIRQLDAVPSWRKKLQSSSGGRISGSNRLAVRGETPTADINGSQDDAFPLLRCSCSNTARYSQSSRCHGAPYPPDAAVRRTAERSSGRAQLAAQEPTNTTSVPAQEHDGIQIEGDSDNQHDVAVHAMTIDQV